MDLYKNPVGNNLYVWSGKRGASSADQCIITAHGASRISDSGMAGLNVQLIYYTPHGTTLSDPTLQKLIIGAVSPYESMPAHESHDYDLGKYTNTHAVGGNQHNEANESYKSVGSLYTEIDTKEHSLKKNAQEFRNAGMSSYADNLEIEAAQYSHYARHDVITLRNRMHRTYNSLTLSEVIRTLQRYGYNYNTIHCAFCR